MAKKKNQRPQSKAISIPQHSPQLLSKAGLREGTKDISRAASYHVGGTSWAGCALKQQNLKSSIAVFVL